MKHPFARHPVRLTAALVADLRGWTERGMAVASRAIVRGRATFGWAKGQQQAQLVGLREAEVGAREHAARLGDAFLATGGRLQEQVRLTTALAEASGRFRALAEPDDGANPARQAVERIECTLRRLDQAQEENAALVERLQEQHAAIAGLRAAGYQLERAFAPLKIIDTLFRIEAATLPADLQAAFAALTHEIADLDHRVRDTFARNFEALSLTRDAIGEVVARLTEQRSSIHEVARTHREAMTQSLAAVQNDIEALRQRDHRARALVDRVERGANGMVMSLQYQDITKQKLEHVLEAIGDLERRVGARGGEARSSRQYVRHSCALQARQLDAIDADLEQALATLDTGLKDVLRNLDALQDETTTGGRGDTLAGQVSGTLQRLGEMLGALPAPSAGVAENARHVAGALHSFGGVTADLGATISDLTWGIRLIALNAQVQAAQVARCDGLEVLARNTYAVSEETSLLAEKIGSDLVALADRLRALVIDANAFQARTERESAELSAAVTDLTTRLQAQRDQVSVALDDFGRTLVAARAAGHDLVANSELAHLDRQPLTGLRQRFQEMADACAAENTGKHAEPTLELQELRQNYTMESERAVHAAVLRDLRGPAAAAMLTGAAEIHGGTESPSSPGGPETSPPGGTDSPGGAGTPHPGGKEAPASASTDLGDNVELF